MDDIHWTQNGTIDWGSLYRFSPEGHRGHPSEDGPVGPVGVTSVFRTREQHICCSLLPAWLVVITSIWIVCCTDALQLPDWRLAFQSTDLKSILCVGWTWIVLPRRNRLWTDPIFWNFVIVLKYGNPTNKQCTIYPIYIFFCHGGEVLETFPPLVSMDRWENQLESFGTTFLRGGKKPMACGRFSLEPSIDKCDSAKKMMPRLSPGSLADTCGMVMTGDYWRWVPNQGIHLSISQPINLSIDPSIDQAINQSCNLSFDRSMDRAIYPSIDR